MTRRRALRSSFPTFMLAGLLLVGCGAQPPAPGIGISNGTTLAVTLVVNGSPVGIFAAGSDGVVPPNALPRLPWVVEARSPSGRVLTSMTVHQGDVGQTQLPNGGQESHGDGARVDLSCGRLDIWSGPPLLGPMPGPGVPGDCLP